jgi:3-hydroxyisobutyrate dehydrogenase-like beta-hydroxyacid dehydrogenase
METKIGFIGVGEMGFPMAKRLIEAGYQLTVFDIVKEPLLSLQNAGAQIAGSAKEVSQKSEIVTVMVRTTAQAERVISGDNGVLEGAHAGLTILLMSTIDPMMAKKLAGIAKEKGADLLDAPVSGARQGAETGTLTVMVGGAEEVSKRCKPIFDVLGKNIFYLGEVGMGESAKLINNLLLLVNMSAAYEAVALGKKAGVKMDVLFDLIKVSTGNSWVIEHWDMVTSWKDKYKVGGTLDLIYKDINLTLDLGENLKVPLYLSSLAKQLVRY